MSFEEHVKSEIRHHGPMSVATFMGLAVAHYYDSRDPFGAEGDFTTAPEISQMFGELLGAWAADCWVQMGRPSAFALAECGPGRGTLMADALRATRNLPGFHAAAHVHLIEASKTLMERQAEALNDFDVQWHVGLESLPVDVPVILLANEFLDALPVRQFQFSGGRWHERVVGLDDAGWLRFGLVPHMPEYPPKAQEGDFFETSPARRLFVESVCERLKRQGGAALFIDYGYTQGRGDTLQAVKNHKFQDVLEAVGEADLTAHVDFSALGGMDGVAVHGPAAQGAFLERLGIVQRAAMLARNAAPEQAAAVEAALTRLTGKDEMGELFKVMAFTVGNIVPAGFDDVQAA